MSHAYTRKYTALPTYDTAYLFMIPPEHARAYDVRATVNLATHTYTHPSCSWRRVDDDGATLVLYLATPLLVFMLTGRLYWLWINREQIAVRVSAGTHTRVWGGQGEFDNESQTEREERSIIGGNLRGHIRMPAARFANTRRALVFRREKSNVVVYACCVLTVCP